MKKITLEAMVISDKMNQTAVVELTFWRTSRLLGKRYRVRKRLQVHNPDNTYKVRQKVRIAPTRPISRHKSWTITSLLNQAQTKKPPSRKRSR